MSRHTYSTMQYSIIVTELHLPALILAGIVEDFGKPVSSKIDVYSDLIAAVHLIL